MSARKIRSDIAEVATMTVAGGISPSSKPEVALNRKSLTEQLREILEARIVNGDLQPGTRLSEEAIAAEFGISRSPVREVLAALEREGLADRVGLRDRRVATPTAKFVLDTYETWIILEVNRTFISSQHATVDDHRRIAQALTQMQEALALDRPRDYAALAIEFPALLHTGCDNLQLISVLKDFEKYRRWLSTLYMGEAGPSQMELDEHRQIGQAYIAADLPALTLSIQTHVRKQRDQVLHKLGQSEAARAA